MSQPAPLTTPSAPEEFREYRLLAESIPVLAWIAEADGSIYWYNRRWFEYTGATAEQMRGWGWKAVHDPAVLPTVMVRWQASIASGQPFEMTFPIKGVDGVFRPFLTRVVPLNDADGNVLRWFGTNTEIGDELRAVAALRESEQRFRTATEAISGILWTNTPDGRMEGEQRGWSGFTGQTLEQYQGYGWADAVHPEDVQPTIFAWQQAVRQGCLFSFEHRVKRHDGAYRLCTVRALPIRDNDGALREWVGVHTDVTEDRKVQQALREQQELVQVAQITNNVGFWRYHPQDSRLYLSIGARHLLGLPIAGETPFKESFSNVHPDDSSRMLAALEESLRTGQYAQEFRVASPATNDFRWILAVARILHSSDGEPYFVGVNLDITQQKRSAEALIHTEKLAVAGRLAASIAHEINNPLEAVTNLLYLLEGTHLSAEQRNLCSQMKEELRRVSEIATHTLQFHRQSTLPNDVRIGALVDSVLTLFAGRIRNAGIEIVCQLAATKAIFGFDGEIRQVLANLVSNAVDAMSASTGPRRLLIRTCDYEQRVGKPCVGVTVADTGSGIPPAMLAHIFDPFFTTKGETGTGLGLWVSSEIVRKHHGVMRVRSRQGAAAHGTVFRVVFPVTAQEAD